MSFGIDGFLEVEHVFMLFTIHVVVWEENIQSIKIELHEKYTTAIQGRNQLMQKDTVSRWTTVGEGVGGRKFARRKLLEEVITFFFLFRVDESDTVERLFELHEPYTHVETSGDVQ